MNMLAMIEEKDSSDRQLSTINMNIIITLIEPRNILYASVIYILFEYLL